MTPPNVSGPMGPVPWAPVLLLLLWLGAVLAGTPPALAGDLTIGHAMPPVVPFELRGDLRDLPMVYVPSRPFRPLRTLPGRKVGPTGTAPDVAAEPGLLAPMPPASQSFAGLSFLDSCGGTQCGDGWPPDPNGDVGLNYYIEAVNTGYAVYTKTGMLLTSFTENALFAGAVGTPCNGDSAGDPIVLYDQQANRWILTNFAFATSGHTPLPPFYQCIAVSKTSDPVAGGWWLSAVRMDPGGAGLPPMGAINDYPKFGIWTDCLYMAANEFDETQVSEPFIGTAVASFSRADLYAGAVLTWALGFIDDSTDPFTMIPSNLRGRGQSSLPMPGTPNYFVSQSTTQFAFEVRKFTAGANCSGGFTLGPATNVSVAAYTIPPVDSIPQPGTSNLLDTVDDRLMQKVQYRRVGATESLWVLHNVKSGSTVKPQWAQIDVTGGVVATTPVQQQIYAPDATLNRWMGSLAVDRQGNTALGYSTSNGTSPNFPSIASSGRLAVDPLNTLPQTEVQLVAGAGSQKNMCGGAPCHRWGDYTAMSVDPADDCTFWYVNQYYDSPTDGASGNWQTRIDAFKYPSCRPLPVFCCKDFNGGGQADILWREFSGTVALWLMNGTIPGATGLPGSASADWAIVGIGDFNGDGKADILWRNSVGTLAIWLMNGTAIIATALPATVTLDWTIEGVGDFNDDGKADILWRHSSGAVAIWLMNGTSVGASGVLGSATLDWTIWGVGDFDHDGRADILWRNAAGTLAIWLINGLSIAGTGILGAPGTDWTIAGVGDFNGDGRADILWRHDSGTVAVWLMNGTAIAGSGVPGNAPADSMIVGVGDFNLDTKADILWRNSAGNFFSWLMNGTGVASTASSAGASSDWQVQ